MWAVITLGLLQVFGWSAPVQNELGDFPTPAETGRVLFAHEVLVQYPHVYAESPVTVGESLCSRPRYAYANSRPNDKTNLPAGQHLVLEFVTGAVVRDIGQFVFDRPARFERVQKGDCAPVIVDRKLRDRKVAVIESILANGLGRRCSERFSPELRDGHSENGQLQGDSRLGTAVSGISGRSSSSYLTLTRFVKIGGGSPQQEGADDKSEREAANKKPLVLVHERHESLGGGQSGTREGWLGLAMLTFLIGLGALPVLRSRWAVCSTASVVAAAFLASVVFAM